MPREHSGFVANQKLIEKFETRSQRVLCGEEVTLFRQGDSPRGLYILRRGEATLTMFSESGTVLMRLRASGGSVLGLPAVLGRVPYSLTAEVHRGAEVSFVAQRDFEELVKADPALCLGLCEVLAAEVRCARQAIAGR